MKKPKSKVSHVYTEAEEWKGKYLRALADYQNLEKRTHEEIGNVRQYASKTILERLLPIVDTFQLANKHIEDKGLQLAVDQLMAMLDEQGVKKIETVGRMFNPHEMECVEVVDGPANSVVEEASPGYTLHGKILRIAEVKVGRSNQSAST